MAILPKRATRAGRSINGHDAILRPVARAITSSRSGLSTPSGASTTRTRRLPCAAANRCGAAPEPPAFDPRQETDPVARSLAA
jgi:hypothetical protein